MSYYFGSHADCFELHCTEHGLHLIPIRDNQGQFSKAECPVCAREKKPIDIKDIRLDDEAVEDLKQAVTKEIDKEILDDLR